MAYEQEIDRYILSGGSVTRWFPNDLTERVEGPAFEHLYIVSDKPIKTEADPTLISKKLDIMAKKFSKVRVVHGTGKHGRQTITAHNGIAQADEGRVVFDPKVCPACKNKTLKWNANGAHCLSCGYRSS